MTPVFQTIIDKGNGNCLQAAVASLFDKQLDEVPHFISFVDTWWSMFQEYFENNGYKYKGNLHNRLYNQFYNITEGCFKERKFHLPMELTKTNLRGIESIGGYYLATVHSPNNTRIQELPKNTHSVIINSDMKIVHDPNPEYKNILKYPFSDLIKCNGVISVEIFSKI